MRHKKQQVKLGRKTAQRKALLSNLAESLILHNSIKTTRAKAKALKMFVEPLVTIAREDTLSANRSIRKVLHTDKAVNKLLREIAPKYKDRNGGYTRVVKLGNRRNDGADIVEIEFV